MATLQNALALYPELRFNSDNQDCMPTLYLRDETNYANIGLTASDVVGIFRVEIVPNDTKKSYLIYNNNSFLTPDISGTDKDVELELCCYKGKFCGQLRIKYSIFDKVSGSEYYKDFSYSFCFEPVEFTIDHYLDCYKPALRSVDNTNYNISGAKRTQVAYSHQVYSSNYIGVTSTAKEVSITTPNLYTETYYSKINSKQKYEFKQTNGVFTVVFESSKEQGFDVYCITDTQGLICCLECLQDDLRKDPENYALQQKYQTATGMLALHKQLLKCDKTEQASMLARSLSEYLDCGGTPENCNCIKLEEVAYQLTPIDRCKECYNS